MTHVARQIVIRLKGRQQRWLRIVLAVAIAVWSIVPTIGHSPVLADASELHAGWVADHGHSHGSAEDFWWASHGHSHEQADHEHSSFYIFRPIDGEPGYVSRPRWRLPARRLASDFPEPLERPPRG